MEIDSCGIRKTISSLCYIFATDRRTELGNATGNGKFRPPLSPSPLHCTATKIMMLTEVIVSCVSPSHISAI